MDFNIDISTKDSDTIQGIVSGEIDAYTAPILREKLETVKIQNGIKIELDFSNVNYMDSTGLGVIVTFYKNVVANEGEIKLTGFSNRLKRLFDITGLSEIMNIEQVGKVTTNNERI
ncbi:STAS domain-containing protein [Rummeliibacillus sp. JY-2-4R]